MLMQGATACLNFSLSDATGPIVLDGANVLFIFRRNEFETPNSFAASLVER